MSSFDVKSPQVVVKVTSNVESMSREAKNYDRVNGLISTLAAAAVGAPEGQFVRKLQYQREVGTNAAFGKMESGGGERSALVLEKGRSPREAGRKDAPPPSPPPNELFSRLPPPLSYFSPHHTQTGRQRPQGLHS